MKDSGSCNRKLESNTQYTNMDSWGQHVCIVPLTAQCNDKIADHYMGEFRFRFRFEAIVYAVFMLRKYTVMDAKKRLTIHCHPAD